MTSSAQLSHDKVKVGGEGCWIAQLLSELLAIVSTSRSSQGILIKPDFAVEACITTIRLLKWFYCGFKLILESRGGQNNLRVPMSDHTNLEVTLYKEEVWPF